MRGWKYALAIVMAGLIVLTVAWWSFNFMSKKIHNEDTDSECIIALMDKCAKQYPDWRGLECRNLAELGCANDG